ncbi:MAG: transcriptional coactivator p15/PC4 family protein [Polyangiaceae bacterium]|nr:transcriptional coactivator p15/PC4 family protein [Polyangiaceae bacterium]
MADADRVLASLTRKDGAEELRIMVRSYNGARYVDLRLWWRDDSGEMRPSAKGVTVRRSEIAAVLSALDAGLADLEGRKVEEGDPTASWA